MSRTELVDKAIKLFSREPVAIDFAFDFPNDSFWKSVQEVIFKLRDGKITKEAVRLAEDISSYADGYSTACLSRGSTGLTPDTEEKRRYDALQIKFSELARELEDAL